MEYVFSDPHFGDIKLHERARPQFKDVEDAANHIIQQWNKTVVNDGDVVYLLGDLGSNRELVKKVIPQLRGKIILIAGNHDNYNKQFYNDLFAEVHWKPLYYHDRILLSHIPRVVGPGILNIHGHTHDIYLKSNQHINVSAEAINYTPQPMKRYMKMLGSLPKENIKFLQEWYKDIQISTKPRDDLILKNDGTIDAEESLKLIKARIESETQSVELE